MFRLKEWRCSLLCLCIVNVSSLNGGIPTRISWTNVFEEVVREDSVEWRNRRRDDNRTLSSLFCSIVDWIEVMCRQHTSTSDRQTLKTQRSPIAHRWSSVRGKWFWLDCVWVFEEYSDIRLVVNIGWGMVSSFLVRFAKGDETCRSDGFAISRAKLFPLDGVVLRAVRDCWADQWAKLC